MQRLASTVPGTDWPMRRLPSVRNGVGQELLDRSGNADTVAAEKVTRFLYFDGAAHDADAMVIHRNERHRKPGVDLRSEIVEHT